MSLSFLSSRFVQELPHSIHRETHGDLTIDVRENSQYRWLTFANGVVQSAMSRTEPDRLVLPYTYSMLAPLIFDDDPQQVLALGIGGGSLVRYLRATFPSASLTACDSSAAVVDIAKQYFGLPQLDDRFRIEVTDARALLAKVADQDLILVDIFDEEGMPPWIDSPNFLRACAGALSETGIVAINLMPNDETRLANILRAIRSVFLGRVLVTTLVDYRNVIVLALQSPPEDLTVAKLGRHANDLERRFGIPLGRVFRNICGVNVCRHGKLVI